MAEPCACVYDETRTPPRLLAMCLAHACAEDAALAAAIKDAARHMGDPVQTAGTRQGVAG